MPIPLNKHVKVWFNAKGIIPKKIIDRLIFQKQIRPNDELTFFVNDQCLEGSKPELQDLEKNGIKIKNIERNLSTKIDDEYLVTLVRNILKKAEKSHDVKDAVFFTDVFRLLNAVQREGLYSDNDVLFLNRNDDKYLSTPYLYGNHNSKFFTDLIFDTAEAMYDIHIFGVDDFTRKKFHQNLIVEFKKLFHHDKPPTENDAALYPFPGISVVNLVLNEANHGHLDFNATKDNVVSGKDNSHCGGEAQLYLDADPLLEYAKEHLQQKDIH